jgi:hypothetical protein
MPGFRFIDSQGEPQVFGREESGSGFEYLVRFMLWERNPLVQNAFQAVASFQQLDNEFFEGNGIVCPIMMGDLVPSERNPEFNTIFRQHKDL